MEAAPLDRRVAAAAAGPDGSTWREADLPTRWGRVLASIALLAICFSIIEHDTIFANATVTGIAEDKLRDRYIDQIKHGNALRQVAVLLFGGAGVAMLFGARRPLNVRWSVAGPLLTLTALAVVSTLWSDQPVVTAKRLIVLLCLVVGSAGLARFLRPSELMLSVLLALVGFVCGSAAVDMAYGGRPWQLGDYRFGGTLHPNGQAAYCGVLCVAAACQPIGFGRRWMLRLVFVAGVGAILLTQSRTGLLSLLLAMVFVWVTRLPSLFRWAGVALILAGAAGVFTVWHSVGEGVRSRAVDAALLGRKEQSKSLTGRVPLWEELVDYAGDKPWLGYGYEGFWTPKRIAAIMKSQNWTLQNAHNSYFEIVLQLGAVGLVVAMLLLVNSLLVNQAAYDLTRDPGYAFINGVIFLGAANSTLESLFVKLRLPSTIALIGVLSVALFYPQVSAAMEQARGRRVAENDTDAAAQAA